MLKILKEKPSPVVSESEENAIWREGTARKSNVGYIEQ
jgi:hypothetical protein